MPFVWLALVSAAAQEPSPIAIHTTTRLVQLNVLVHNSKGAPVRDLRKEDFTVLDQGRARPIAFFRMEEERQVSEAARAERSRTINNRDIDEAAQASATVILVDSLNMGGTQDLLYVKHELPKFLRSLKPGEPVAIYNLAGPTVKVIHEFSDDPDALIRTADKSTAVGQWFSSLADTSLKSPDPHIIAEWTLSALESIALHLADVPGRKTLIWISGAFPIALGFDSTESMAGGAATRQLPAVTSHAAKAGDLETFRERLLRLARIMNRVDLAVYPVDPSGLAVDSHFDADQHPLLTLQGGPASRVSTPAERRSAPFATMDLIAWETGGKAFYNANALGESIQRAVDDSRVTYVLGFYPDPASWDGKFHSLNVQVDRPGITVRTRRSYFGGDLHPEKELERDAALRAAASVPLGATAIRVTVNVESNPLQPGYQQITVGVDPRDLHFVAEKGMWHSDFDLVLTQQIADDRRITGERNRCVLDRESYEASQNEDVLVVRTIVVNSAAASLRVVVRDPWSGAVGSLDIPVAQWRMRGGRLRERTTEKTLANLGSALLTLANQVHVRFGMQLFHRSAQELQRRLRQ